MWQEEGLRKQMQEDRSWADLLEAQVQSSETEVTTVWRCSGIASSPDSDDHGDDADKAILNEWRLPCATEALRHC